VFLLTSRSEGLSIAMVEAMAHGVPVVCSDVGELSDLVVNDRMGWLVRSDSPEEYAERVLALLQDDALWRCMSTEARGAAEKSVSVDRVAQRWRDAFDLIAASPRPVLAHVRAGRERVEV
jgi:phosphatidylinositol alpha-1,6-mannosyltransferase